MDQETRTEIETAASFLLRECEITKAPTVLTPVLQEKQLELFPFDEPEHGNIPLEIREAVRAFIDVPDRHIYLSNKLHAKRKRFASFHEVGHYVLPWHKETFYHCSEMDLSPDARKMFEIEANHFSASCLFQGKKFAEEADDSSFGFKALIPVADKYEVSYESAARRVVQTADTPRALLVFNYKQGEDGKPKVSLKYHIASPSFPIQIANELELSHKHILHEICATSTSKPMTDKFLLAHGTHNETKCSGSMFFNQYKMMVLLKPRKYKSGTFHLL